MKGKLDYKMIPKVPLVFSTHLLAVFLPTGFFIIICFSLFFSLLLYSSSFLHSLFFPFSPLMNVLRLETTRKRVQSLMKKREGKEKESKSSKRAVDEKVTSNDDSKELNDGKEQNGRRTIRNERRYRERKG